MKDIIAKAVAAMDIRNYDTAMAYLKQAFSVANKEKNIHAKRELFRSMNFIRAAKALRDKPSIPREIVPLRGLKRYQVIEALLPDNRPEFAHVTFIKADGTERKMTINRAAMKGKLAKNPDPVKKRAAETSRVINPHLLTVYDVDAKDIRYVNMDSVKEIRAFGKVWEFHG